MYNLIKYSDNYSKIPWILSQYYRDEPFLGDNDAIVDFFADKNNSASFKLKKKLTGQTADGGKKDVEIKVPLKFLRKF